MRSDFQDSKICLECGEVLEETSDVFKGTLLTKYVCPKCGTRYKVRTAYHITEVEE